MHEIVLDKDSVMHFRPTPWDTRLFGFNTSEIMEIRYRDGDALSELLQRYDEYNSRQSVKFTYMRIDANDRLLKRKLQDSGFYYAETSICVTKKDLPTYENPYHISIPLAAPVDEDFPQMREIAKNDFFYGRFHEDPHVDIAKARERYMNIIDDQRELKRDFLVYKRDGEVVGFHIQSVSESTSAMILTGTRKERSLVSYYFWASILKNLKERGIREASTVISVANVPIVNLYSFFGFRIEKTLVGFHKLYTED